MRAIWAKNFDRRLSLTNWKYRVLSDVLLLLLLLPPLLLLFWANTTHAVMQYSCKGRRRRKLTYIDQHFDSLSKDFITQLSFVFKVCIVLLSVSLKMSCLPQIKKNIWAMSVQTWNEDDAYLFATKTEFLLLFTLKVSTAINSQGGC